MITVTRNNGNRRTTVELDRIFWTLKSYYGTPPGSGEHYARIF